VFDHVQATGGTTTSGKTFTFGCIKTELRATLTTQAGQPTVGQQTYVPNKVTRDTIYTYDAGKPVFELTAPNGDVYVMQSYAQIVAKKLDYQDLRRLATRLKLPHGWLYSSKKRAHTLKLVSTGSPTWSTTTCTTPTSRCASSAISDGAA
jgi:hypothetical protein